MPHNPDLIGQDFQGVLRIGGADTEQLFVQDRLALRDDFSASRTGTATTRSRLGVVLSRMGYDVTKFFTANPVFRFRSTEDFAFPFEAQYGLGDPDARRGQHAVGPLPAGRLEPDRAADHQRRHPLGLRDEPAQQRLRDAGQRGGRRAAASCPPNYFTDGDDRPALQGRLPAARSGFSYDLSGNGQTVVFGGYGRYYDRVLYNSGLDERFRQQFAVRTFRFSADGAPRDGQPTAGLGSALPERGRPRRPSSPRAARATRRSS